MKTPESYVGLREAIELLKTQGIKVVRHRYRNVPILDYLDQIQDPVLRTGLRALYEAHPFFSEAPAGARHHHWWAGGLENHCTEMIGLGLDLMDLYSGDVSFSKDDLITTVFLHDFSKVWIYRYITPEEREKKPKTFNPKQVFTYRAGATDILDAEGLTATTLMRFGIPITDRQWSAVLFAEGGFSSARFGFAGQPTHTGTRVTHENALAAFVAMLDSYSSQLLGQELR